MCNFLSALAAQECLNRYYVMSKEDPCHHQLAMRSEPDGKQVSHSHGMLKPKVYLIIKSHDYGG